jgi:ribonuclease E
MVVRQSEEYSQLAVLEDGALVEHYVDRSSAASSIGNIYLGKVQNVLPSMEAAFVDIGRGRNAVLYAGEVDWARYGKEGEPRRIEHALKSGDQVLVQVSKDPVGQKGARLTSHIIDARPLPRADAPGGSADPGSPASSPTPSASGSRRSSTRTSPSDASRHRAHRRRGGLRAAAGARRSAGSRASGRSSRRKQPESSHAPPMLCAASRSSRCAIVRDLFTADFTELVSAGDGGPEDDLRDRQADYVERRSSPDSGRPR